MNFQIHHLKQVERIKIKLRLAKNTDNFLEVFGAKSHQYVLNAPASLAEVSAFEKKYQIELPQGYKVFLTEIGNGGIDRYGSVVGNSGAGPAYGIFKLGHEKQFMIDLDTNYLATDCFFDEKTSEEAWSKIFRANGYKDHLKKAGKAYAGILFIAFRGCTFYNGILLNGTHKGRILNTSDEIEDCPDFDEAENFLDWYENWIDKIIWGDSIFTLGRTNRTEAQCIERFLADKEPKWKLVTLAYIRSFDTVSDKTKQLLWDIYKKDEDVTVRQYALNVLSKLDYPKAKKELCKLCPEHPLELLKILHLYAPKHTIDWRDEIRQIQKIHDSNIEVREYLEYITEKDLNG